MDLAGLARTPVGEITRRGSTICKQATKKGWKNGGPEAVAQTGS